MDEVEQEKQEELVALEKSKQELMKKLEMAMQEKLKLQAESVEKSLLDKVSAKLAETIANSAEKAQGDAEKIEALTKNTAEITQEI